MRRFFTRYASLPYLLALLGVWVAFFWQYFIPGPGRVTFPTGDFTYQFYIFRDIAYRALAAGHWPGWADCFFAGYPFQADPQSQLFYVPIWLSYGTLKVLGWGNFPIFALTIETTLHYLVASFFLFLFLRTELRDSIKDASNRSISLSALLGAVVFSYGGYLTGYAPLQTAILETVTWLPLILWLLNRLASAQTHEWRWVVLAALVLGLAFFAGHPQTFLFVVYVSVAYFVYRSGLAARSWRWTILRLIAVFGLLFGLSLVQLLPQAQYLTLSNRSGLTFDELAGGYPFGIVTQFFINDVVWSPLYVGLLPLALVLIAVIGLRSKPVFFWLSVGVVGFLLALGGNTPLYALAYWVLPGYRLFRDQERLALLVSFALAVLAAYGTLWLLTVEKTQTRRAVQIAAVSVCVLAGLALWKTYDPTLADWMPRAGLAIGALVVAGVVLLAQQYFAMSPSVAGGMLIAVAALNLLMARTASNTVPDFEAYPYNPILDPIRADETPFFRVQDDARMQGHFACGYGLKEWAGISPIRPAAWEVFEQQAPESLRWKLIAMKYLITWRNGAITPQGDLPPAEKVAEGEAPGGETKVYRMFEIPKRAWLVTSYQSTAEASVIFDQLKAPGFDPFVQAVLRATPNAPAISASTPPFENNVTVVEDWPGHLTLEVGTADPALLLVSEAYYPGWVARVNGQATDVYEADGLVQALQVPAGESTVTLDFQPWLLTVGAVGSLLTLLVCVAVLTARRPSPQN